MSSSSPRDFSQTLRSAFEEPRKRPRAAGLAAAVTLAAWVVWMTSARVPVYVSSPKARIEVSRAAWDVAIPRQARVKAMRAVLGARVSEGDILVELDASVEERRLEEARTRIAFLARRRAAITAVATAEQAALDCQLRLGGATVARSRQTLVEMEAVAKEQEDLFAITKSLREADLASKTDFVRDHAEAQVRRAQSLGARIEVHRSGLGRDLDARRGAVRLAELNRDRVEIETEEAQARAAETTLRTEIDQLLVRAPGSGTIGELHARRAGDVLAAGEHVATVLGPGDLHVVAYIPEAQAAGKMRGGQTARVRPDGYAWPEFDAIDAEVSAVAEEPRDGEVRVELVLRANAAAVPPRHGLVGTIDVEVERVRPLTLLLRSVGARTSERTERTERK